MKRRGDGGAGPTQDQLREDPSVEAKHTGAEQNIRLHTRLKIVGQGLLEGSNAGRAGSLFLRSGAICWITGDYASHCWMTYSCRLATTCTHVRARLLHLDVAPL